jgi:hypothetical protein
MTTKRKAQHEEAENHEELTNSLWYRLLYCMNHTNLSLAELHEVLISLELTCQDRAMVLLLRPDVFQMLTNFLHHELLERRLLGCYILYRIIVVPHRCLRKLMTHPEVELWQRHFIQCLSIMLSIHKVNVVFIFPIEPLHDEILC